MEEPILLNQPSSETSVNAIDKQIPSRGKVHGGQEARTSFPARTNTVMQGGAFVIAIENLVYNERKLKFLTKNSILPGQRFALSNLEFPIFKLHRVVDEVMSQQE